MCSVRCTAVLGTGVALDVVGLECGDLNTQPEHIRTYIIKESTDSSIVVRLPLITPGVRLLWMGNYQSPLSHPVQVGGAQTG